MATKKEIFRRMQAVASTHKMVEAMKLISITKLGKAKKELQGLLAYMDELQRVAVRVHPSHPLIIPIPQSSEPHPAAMRTYVLIITADRGFCGSYNSATVGYALRHYTAECADYAVMGKQGIRALKLRVAPFSALSFPADQHAGMYTDHIIQHVLHIWASAHYRSVRCIYHDGKRVMDEPLLPFSYAFQPVANEVAPIVEPDSSQVAQYVAQQMFELSIRKKMLVSKVGEEYARMFSMSQAADNASSLLKSLRMSYNIIRQGMITKEICEIAAARVKTQH